MESPFFPASGAFYPMSGKNTPNLPFIGFMPAFDAIIWAIIEKISTSGQMGLNLQMQGGLKNGNQYRQVRKSFLMQHKKLRKI